MEPDPRPEAVRRRDHLIRGLIGPYGAEYHGSASFHAAINTLAEMLPLMVDGLAVDAARRNAYQQEMLAKLMDPSTPPNLAGLPNEADGP